MPNITTCPECANPVTVPDGLAESAVVRCPVCEAEYPAEEVMNLTVEVAGTNDANLPPELTPVDPSLKTESDSSEEEAGPLVKCPCCDAQFGLAEVIVAATGEVLGSEAAAAIGPDGSIASADEKPAALPSFGPSGESRAPFGIAIDTGEEAAPSAPSGFDFQDKEADHRDNALSTMASAGRPRRRRGSEKHALRFIAEVVFGGVTGLTITYYGLNFFGGERFDWFDLYLPGVVHTEQYRPEWWPAKSGQPDSEETDANPNAAPADADVLVGDGFSADVKPVEAKPAKPPKAPPIPAEKSSEEPAEESKE